MTTTTDTDRWHVAGSDGLTVCDGSGLKVGFFITPEDARLAAAAPALLALAREYRESADYQRRRRENEGDDEGARMTAVTIRLIDEAIAEAEGRS